MKKYPFTHSTSYHNGMQEFMKGYIGFFCEKCFEPKIVGCDIRIGLWNINKKEYKSDLFIQLENYSFECPKCGHFNNWKGAPLDPNITPMIAKLNKKGFETYCSCEGHDDEYTPYILFKDNKLDEYLLNGYDIEYPWYMEDIESSGYITIDKDGNEIKVEATHISADTESTLEERLLILDKWVDSLPNIMEEKK